MLQVVFLLWILPILGIVGIIIVPDKLKSELINLIVAIGCFAASLYIVIFAPYANETLLKHYILISPIGNWVTLCIGIVYLLSSIYAVGYMRLMEVDPKKLSYFYSLFSGFALTMFIAPFMNNPGLYWVAIDLTTIVSAFLIGFEKEAESIEASWKYLIIVSAGLSLGLLGIVLFYWGGTFHLGAVYSMTWANLHSISKTVPTVLLLSSFLLVLVGFGTKAGLAPMHTWLPDAHSEGPAPVSAMLSGALLNIAMLGIVRFLGILKGTKSFELGHLSLIVLGLFSLFVAALFIVRQDGIKRLMAYSSIEHIGIITISFGFGGVLGIAGGMYQMLNHSLTKSLMFFGSGSMMRHYGSKRIQDIKRILSFFPTIGLIWLLGAIAITGAPPFGLFLSEFTILRSGFKGNNSWASWIMGILLISIFISFLNHFRSMYFGEPMQQELAIDKPLSKWLTVPMWLSFIPIVILGFWWPHALWNFFIMAGKNI